jgi:hypothetical protein
MNSIKILLEVGQKRTFAGGLDWPGWCRSGKDEETALQALFDYAPRYARVLQAAEIDFPFTNTAADFLVKERLEGNATTDFGAPVIIPEADRESLDRTEFERLLGILHVCWQAFDAAVQRASGKELRTGPRGGGRDLETIQDHVLGAERAYLAKLAWKYKSEGGINSIEETRRTRQAIVSALEAAFKGELPKQGPRGGTVWPPRYFIRRTTWHVLDHAWEIDDRII